MKNRRITHIGICQFQVFILALSVLAFAVSLMSCDRHQNDNIDTLNELSYNYHYINLDSTLYYANKAYAEAEDYTTGQAEALNNLAFVKIAQMDYKRAKEILDSIPQITQNEIERLVADVQNMRLCQRKSSNKDFYVYRESAEKRLKRIKEDASTYNHHQNLRILYAETEMHIVETAYFYYVGLDSLSRDAINQIDVEKITANDDVSLLLNYYYNMGSGGMIVGENKNETWKIEVEWLLRCYQIAKKHGYKYWEANALQAISEHVVGLNRIDPTLLDLTSALQLVATDEDKGGISPPLLAKKALEIFSDYGDTYQVAGGLRSLAESYFYNKDFDLALDCLEEALNRDTLVYQAPDLVASIRERLSMTFSALNEKQLSDYNRNIYLDLQEDTRQDRHWEARMAQLEGASHQINAILVGVGLVFLVTCLLLLFIYKLQKREDETWTSEKLSGSLLSWKSQQDENRAALYEYNEEQKEKIEIIKQKLSESKRRNVEQRAKVSMLTSIRPLLDRLVKSTKQLLNSKVANNAEQLQQYDYVKELVSKLEDYNQGLSRWIEMRRGELSIQVESFCLTELFDIINKSSASFERKGVRLIVEPTNDIVKADKALTLFMINTLSDNARKFTAEGGQVEIYSESFRDYVEIFVRDTGRGMSAEEVAHLFDKKAIIDEKDVSTSSNTESHGFGLLNCKGIIEKYKKTSNLFQCCDLFVKSEENKGTTFSFRLPIGRLMSIALFLMTALSIPAKSSLDLHLENATAYADSLYTSNINSDFSASLVFADSCIEELNHAYSITYPKGNNFLTIFDEESNNFPEIIWYRNGVNIDYGIILSLRNEAAVAALALHDWALYDYNNKTYTQLFRELSADNSISTYAKEIERSSADKKVAAVILSLLILLIILVFYFSYYQKHLRYQKLAERLNQINKILLSSLTTEEKLSKISAIWPKNERQIQNINSKVYVDLISSVDSIETLLEDTLAIEKEMQDRVENDTDEINLLSFENDRLHVVNNILDNCLSTLKHETMYYPARLHRLLDEDIKDIKSIADMAVYYREVFTLLSMQASRQIGIALRPDNDSYNYLAFLLKKINQDKDISWRVVSKDGVHISYMIVLDKINLTPVQLQNIFTPETVDFRFLTCRQLVREIGEWTGLRMCGIDVSQADSLVQSGLCLKLTLPRNSADCLNIES